MKRLALVLLPIFACHGGSAPDIPADRAILGFTGTSATDANRALLPPGFGTPDPHACATDTTRVYILELFKPGPIDQPQVLWHWAPVVPGPDAKRPTLQQPEFSVAGTVAGTDDSTTDVLADHPFGPDVNVDVSPDPAYAFLAYGFMQSTALHTEVETRAFPRVALGYAPAPNDRALMRGAWILDCGHPPYYAEMHPPGFVSYARPLDAKTTVAVALFEPYRSSQFYTQDANVAVQVANAGRFSLIGTKPFPQAMVEAIQFAVVANTPYLMLHPLLEANRFTSLDFLVCAPLPRPAGAKLSATWRFTARTGISIGATPIDSAGCVRFTASMGSDYTPAPVALKTAAWSWQDLSDTASGQVGSSFDVRAAILQGFPAAAGAQALQIDHPPQVDTYDALAPLPGADQDSPSQISSRADGQPFPFYGRVRVAWTP